jgi:outer membrane protein
MSKLLRLTLALGALLAFSADRADAASPLGKKKRKKEQEAQVTEASAQTDTQASKYVEPPPPKDWDVTIGLGAIAFPKYEGSETLAVWPLPYFDIKWKDQVFLSATEGLGWNAWKTRNFRVGPIVTYGLPGDKPSGSNDTDFALHAGLFAEFAFDYWKIDAKFLQSVLGSGEGQRAELGAGAGLKINKKWTLFSRLSTTWMSENEMKTYFGINDREASDLTSLNNLKPKAVTYAPGAGFKDVAFSQKVGYEFTNHWSMLGEAKYARLLGDAADSPLVDRLGSANQFTIWTAVAYKF